MRTERLLRNAAAHRRVGRSPVKSDLDFNIVLGDRIAYMNPVHWDELAEGKSLLLSRVFLSHFEEAGLRSIRMRYGMIYRKDTPAGAVVVRILKLAEASVAAEPAPPRRNYDYRYRRHVP
jgi:hypothetical protein